MEVHILSLTCCLGYSAFQAVFFVGPKVDRTWNSVSEKTLIKCGQLALYKLFIFFIFSSEAENTKSQILEISSNNVILLSTSLD